MPNNTNPSDGEFVAGELDWIEKAAIENLKGRVATADMLAKESVTTLTVLLAGTGGAFAWAIKLFDDKANVGTVAALIASAWLTGLTIYLVWGCLRIVELPAVYNQPGQLLGRAAEGASFEAWRRHELLNIEERIGEAVDRNNRIADRLNLIRILATVTPILSAIGAWVFTQSC
jgi:hypothetical protein